MRALTYGEAPLEEKGADLIDHAGSLPDKTVAHPMNGLRIELILDLGGSKLHGRALDCLCESLGIAEVVLLSLR